MNLPAVLSWRLYAALFCVAVCADLLGGDAAAIPAVISAVCVGLLHLVISTSPRAEYWLACADDFAGRQPVRARLLVVAGVFALLWTWFVLPAYSEAAFPDVLFRTGSLSWHFAATISGDSAFADGSWSYVCWPLVAAEQFVVLCIAGGLLTLEIRRERRRRAQEAPAEPREPVTFRS